MKNEKCQELIQLKKRESVENRQAGQKERQRDDIRNQDG
jgi:hypothetical protein